MTSTRRAQAAWLLPVLAAALLWAALGELPEIARFWSVTLLAGLPALMVFQAQQLRTMPPLPRRAAYTSSMISLWVLLGVTLLVAWLSRLDAVDLSLLPLPGAAAAAAWTVALTAGAVTLLFLFRALGVREAPALRDLLPVTGGDRALFVGVSITAGVCEEIIFRGYLIHTLVVGGAPALPAVLLSSISFAIVHAYQDTAGAVRAGLLGALLAVPVVLGYGLLPSIAAHILIDLISGLWLARHLLRAQ